MTLHPPYQDTERGSSYQTQMNAELRAFNGALAKRVVDVDGKFTGHAIVFLFFVFLAWLFFTTFSLSALIRSRRTEAGSSCGSCGTSWPEKAFFKTDWRRASAF